MFGLAAVAMWCDEVVTGRVLLAASHFAGHLEDELAVFLVEFAEQAAELFEKNGIFAGGAPKIFVRGLPDAEMEGFGRLLAFVEEQVEGDFESFGQLFESVDRGDGVSVLDTRKIGAQKAGAFFDVALREILLFAKLAESLAKYHCAIISLR
jgi:hypothetical protein